MSVDYNEGLRDGMLYAAKLAEGMSLFQREGYAVLNRPVDVGEHIRGMVETVRYGLPADPESDAWIDRNLDRHRAQRGTA